MRTRSAVLVLLFVTTLPRVAKAQFFVGAGLLSGNGSEPARLPFAPSPPCSGASRLLEGGAFVTRYFGLGGEWLSCPDIDSSTGGHSFSTSVKEREDVITTSFRVRVPVHPRLSLQALAGAGVIRSDLVQKLSAFSVFNGQVFDNSTTFQATVTKLAVVGGFDVLFTIVPHVAGGVSLRVYNLHQPTPGPGTAGEWTEFFPGVSVRVFW